MEDEVRQAITVDKAGYEAAVQHYTRLALVPESYQDIIHRDSRTGALRLLAHRQADVLGRAGTARIMRWR